MTVDPQLMPARAEASQQARSTGAKTRFIPEIQGLRTLALFLVVIYHVWFHRVSGGVDVFLLVSAFLMTASVIAATRQGRGFNPATFLVRRFGRLLPLAGATVALTLIGALTFLPVWRWPSLLDDGWASLFYVENMLLQERAADYYSADLTTLSPSQHFWSLSIQGQVFVLWAVTHLIAVLAARITKIPLRVWLALGFGIVFIGSLTFSMWMTEASQERAYFDVRARLWEFALGSLLAVIGEVRIRTSIARLMIYIGVVMIAACGFLLPVGTTFPGIAALWPLSGAGLILLATTRPTSRPTLLAHPWLVRAGAYSYALYLVHWPILVIAQSMSSTGQLGIAGGTAVLATSCAVSIALVHAVENPLARFQRSGSVWRSAGVVVAIFALGAAMLVGLRPYVDNRAAADPGSSARQSWAELGGECDTDLLAEYCSALPGSEPDVPRVTFLGSSHTQQYMAAFTPTIEREGWAAQAYLLPGCLFRTTPGEGRDQTCFEAWSAARSGDLLDDTDVLVILGTASTPEGDRSLDGIDDFVEDVRAHGTEVITIRDVPRFHDNLFACGEQLGHDDAACTVTLDESWADPYASTAASASLDLTAQICPGLECTPTRDGEYVYLDDNHITATFSAQLNNSVDAVLVEVMDSAR